MSGQATTLTFACGASYECAETPDFSHRDRSGRGRLLVYDSEGCNPPMLRGEPAPCLLACPCKRDAGRKQIRAVRSDGRFFPPRAIVTCYATVTAQRNKPEGA